MRDPKGRGAPKLTDEQVREIRDANKWVNWKQKDIAKHYGVTPPVISQILNWQSYRNVK